MISKFHMKFSIKTPIPFFISNHLPNTTTRIGRSCVLSAGILNGSIPLTNKLFWVRLINTIVVVPFLGCWC